MVFDPRIIQTGVEKGSFFVPWYRALYIMGNPEFFELMIELN